MRGMVKFHIEAFNKPGWKCSLRRWNRFEIVVAYGAHQLVVSGDELIEMATNAGFMTGQLDLSRASLSLMTSVACKFFVFGNFVRKRPECLGRNALRDQRSRPDRRDRNGWLCCLLNAAGGERSQRTENE
jgi:hypothetical protein